MQLKIPAPPYPHPSLRKKNVAKFGENQPITVIPREKGSWCIRFQGKVWEFLANFEPNYHHVPFSIQMEQISAGENFFKVRSNLVSLRGV